MPAQEKKHRGRKLLTITVLALLMLLSVVNLKVVIKPIQKFIQREISFEDFTNEVQKGYLSDRFVRKNDFVNLNGLFARLTGRRTLNNVVKLNNGMLDRVRPKSNMTALANSIISFSDYLRERDIPFLYVQMPWKESLDGQSLPVGITSYANENMDNLLFQLSENNVEALDLRLLLTQTPEMLEQYFYKTDHHWNSDGAFVGFQAIMSYLHELFPENNIDMTYAQEDQWERHSIEDWQIGSWGKRVGIYFGGTDPLIWHTPKFETKMSRAVPDRSEFYRGDFTTANIITEYIEKKDYFGYETLRLYTGGAAPLMQHRNLNAPSPLKLLMLKDSFTMPLQSFLSTVFQEIDVIDPRYFSECTVAEYVDRTEPDMVIFGINPNVFTKKAYRNFGVDKATSIPKEESAYELVVQQDIEVEASGDENNYTAYPLESNTLYRVSFDEVDILEGQTEGVGLRLYNKTSEKVLTKTIFDLAYCEATDGFSWTFRTPDTQDELQLLFYAGIYDSTAGNSVIYRNVMLKKVRDNAP